MGVEMFDDHAVRASQRQRLQLVTQIGDAGRCAGREAGKLGEKLARMRFERHDRGIESQARGGGAHVGQQTLMAAMHTVKVANRQGTGSARSGIRYPAKYLHRCRVKNMLQSIRL